MTPVEFEKIALWMGWEKKDYLGSNGWWSAWTKDGVNLYSTADKTSLTPAEALEALERLFSKGYQWSMGVDPDGKCQIIVYQGASRSWSTGRFPTIPAAVEMAIAKLIEREG